MMREYAAAAFTDATNANALSEQSMIAKLVVRKELSFPDWTVSLEALVVIGIVVISRLIQLFEAPSIKLTSERVVLTLSKVFWNLFANKGPCCAPSSMPCLGAKNEMTSDEWR
jgi:hypothetical protein